MIIVEEAWEQAQRHRAGEVAENLHEAHTEEKGAGAT